MKWIRGGRKKWLDGKKRYGGGGKGTDGINLFIYSATTRVWGQGEGWNDGGLKIDDVFR